jgi:hypothetical protein
MPLCFWATQTAVAAADLHTGAGRSQFTPYLPPHTAATAIQHVYRSYLRNKPYRLQVAGSMAAIMADFALIVERQDANFARIVERREADLALSFNRQMEEFALIVERENAAFKLLLEKHFSGGRPGS